MGKGVIELIKRDLDGVYFRVKRGNKWDNVCFTDLTDDELEQVVGDRSRAWWEGLAFHLRDRLRFIGEELDLRMDDGGDE